MIFMAFTLSQNLKTRACGQDRAWEASDFVVKERGTHQVVEQMKTGGVAHRPSA